MPDHVGPHPDDDPESAAGRTPEERRDVPDPELRARAIDGTHPRVDARTVDVKLARKLAHAFNAKAAPLGDPDVNHADFDAHVDEVIVQQHDGRAGRGVYLKTMAAGARSSLGHQREKFERWAGHAALVVRMGVFAARQPLLCSEIVAVPVRVGRRQVRRVGTDKCDGVANSLRLLVLAAAQPDRCTPLDVIEFNTDTRFDRGSVRADRGAIAAAEYDVGHALPGSVGEHLAALLQFDRRTHESAVGRAMEQGLKQDVRNFDVLRRTVLLVDGLPSGPPTMRGRQSARVRFPGRDAEAVEAVREEGRRAILACGPLTEEEAFSLRANRFETFPHDILPAADRLGVVRLGDVEHYWLPDHGVVVRSVVGGGAAARLAFRPVGFSPRIRPWAVTFIERMVQVALTRECLARWEATCGPGMFQAHSPVTVSALYGLLNVGNVAIIGADRWRRPAGG